MSGCDACGAEAWEPRYAADPAGGRWAHRRCAACGLLAVHPLPDQLARINRALYGGAGATPRPASPRQRRWLRQARAACANARPRLLDVGCGAGALVAAAEGLGFEAHGVELEPEVAAQARAAGLTVIAGRLDELPSEPGYDVIRLNQVLEHVVDPAALLGEAAARLRVGGRLHLATPNAEGLAHRVLGDAWRHLGGERNGHLRLFGPEALRRCAAAVGLEPVSLSTRGLRAWSRRPGGGARRLAWRVVERAGAIAPGLLGDVLHAELHRQAVR